MSQRVLIQLSFFNERNLFLRGIIPLIGFRASEVHYDRRERLLGKSKYPFRQMIALAWEGITSFSHVPLRFISIMGIMSFFFSLLLIVWVLFGKLFGQTIVGWASTIIPMCFMGGVQLLSLGVVGEYIAKIYIEVKNRPRYCEDTEIF